MTMKERHSQVKENLRDFAGTSPVAKASSSVAWEVRPEGQLEHQK